MNWRTVQANNVVACVVFLSVIRNRHPVFHRPDSGKSVVKRSSLLNFKEWKKAKSKNFHFFVYVLFVVFMIHFVVAFVGFREFFFDFFAEISFWGFTSNTCRCQCSYHERENGKKNAFATSCWILLVFPLHSKRVKCMKHTHTRTNFFRSLFLSSFLNWQNAENLCRTVEK